MWSHGFRKPLCAACPARVPLLRWGRRRKSVIRRVRHLPARSRRWPRRMVNGCTRSWMRRHTHRISGPVGAEAALACKVACAISAKPPWRSGAAAAPGGPMVSWDGVVGPAVVNVPMAANRVLFPPGAPLRQREFVGKGQGRIAVRTQRSGQPSPEYRATRASYRSSATSKCPPPARGLRSGGSRA